MYLRARVLATQARLSQSAESDCASEDDFLNEESLAVVSFRYIRNSSVLLSFRSGTAVKTGRGSTNLPRPGTAKNDSKRGMTAAMRQRTATARPITSIGAGTIRMNTAAAASKVTQDGFDKMDPRKSDTALLRTYFNYRFYHQNNPRSALEITVIALSRRPNSSAFWLYAQGICYQRLNLYREAKESLEKSLQLSNSSVETVTSLASVLIRLNQPNEALSVLKSSLLQFSGSIRLMLAIADIQKRTNASLASYQQILAIDAGNITALSRMGIYWFNNGKPEITLVLCQRMMQMEVIAASVWCNLGLACFYSQQFDLVFNSFDRALRAVDNDHDRALIWYNVSQVVSSLGDLTLTNQCLQNSLLVDANCAQALINKSALSYRKRPPAQEEFISTCGIVPMSKPKNTVDPLTAEKSMDYYESYLNDALQALASGESVTARSLLQEALKINSKDQIIKLWLNVIECLHREK